MLSRTSSAVETIMRQRPRKRVERKKQKCLGICSTAASSSAPRRCCIMRASPRVCGQYPRLSDVCEKVVLLHPQQQTQRKHQQRRKQQQAKYPQPSRLRFRERPYCGSSAFRRSANAVHFFVRVFAPVRLWTRGSLNSGIEACGTSDLRNHLAYGVWLPWRFSGR